MVGIVLNLALSADVLHLMPTVSMVIYARFAPNCLRPCKIFEHFLHSENFLHTDQNAKIVCFQQLAKRQHECTCIRQYNRKENRQARQLECIDLA